MKNNKLKIFFYLFLSFFLIYSYSIANEEFNFDVTEVEIKEDGNRFFGKKGGIATTPEGLYIEGQEFDYDKQSNILIVTGKIKFDDKKDNFQIFSDKATYKKNNERVFTEGNSRAINDIDKIYLEADQFDYNKLSNILIVNGKVKFDDKSQEIQIFSDKATYLKNREIIYAEGNSKAVNKNGLVITADKLIHNKILNTFDAIGNFKIVDPLNDYIIYAKKINYKKNEEKITSFGKTEAIIESKYDFNSKDLIFYRNKMELMSNKYSTINNDNSTFYELAKFKYYLNDKVLKGEKAYVTTNLNSDKSDKFFFKNIFTNFKSKSFKASETKILFHKNIFDKEREKFIDLENAKLNELFEDYYDENKPRLYGVSSSGDKDKTIVNKGVFTSCNNKGPSPAWCMEAKKITHDKKKRQIIYKDTVLKMYDFPVFYFPKFFHPDPSVIRQSGFLKPELNESKTLGTSFYLPYFHVLSENKDLTLKPTIFDSKILMLQNEYRQENENSSFIADLGLTKGYQSSIKGSNRNNMTHLFGRYTSDLKLENFFKSDLEISLEKTSNDTYLRLFDANIPETKIKPRSKSSLKSGIKLNLDHERYNISGGMTVYETLSGKNSDKFQYIFPYYDFSRSIDSSFDGSLNFSSSGSNTLQSTNNLKTTMSNNLSYDSKDYFSDFGFRNNFGLYFMNFNAIAKNDSIYKNSLQSEVMTIFTLGSSLPLIKFEDDNIINSITPRVSLRYNPTDMKNHSSKSRTINADNIFSLNRLGIGDSYESGRSLTLGVDYKKENLNDIDKFFEFKLSTVLRDKFEQDIPVTSTINRKNSNIFGSITNKFSDFVKLDYNFAIDNDMNTFEYNSINTEFSVNNFVTEFKFTEKNGIMGDENTIENTTSYKIDNNNYFTFNTRRNRKTSLTEYYDLVYEYKNDCLTAGIKYKKTYYSDRDIKPNEDLMFTITLFPLTTFEQKVDQNLYRD
jgi:LPS-assembly protein